MRLRDIGEARILLAAAGSGMTDSGEDAPPTPAPLTTGFALSPAGDQVLFSAVSREGRQRLFLRDRDGIDAVAVPETDGGLQPFCSPDGAWGDFVSEGDLKVVSLAGGPATTLVSGGLVTEGADWGPDDTIADNVGGGIYAIDSTGGEPRRLTVAIFCTQQSTPGC